MHLAWKLNHNTIISQVLHRVTPISINMAATCCLINKPCLLSAADNIFPVLLQFQCSLQVQFWHVWPQTDMTLLEVLHDNLCLSVCGSQSCTTLDDKYLTSRWNHRCSFNVIGYFKHITWPHSTSQATKIAVIHTAITYTSCCRLVSLVHYYDVTMCKISY